MSSSPCSYMITGVETIKQQIRAACVCLVVGQSPWALSWTASYMLYIRSVCETKAPLQPKVEGHDKIVPTFLFLCCHRSL